jgi:hypothetical protein
MQKSIMSDPREGQGEEIYRTEETRQSQTELGSKNQWKKILAQVQWERAQ